MKYTAFLMVIGSVIASLGVIGISVLTYSAMFVPQNLYSYQVLYSYIGSEFAAGAAYAFLMIITAIPTLYFAYLVLRVIFSDIKQCLVTLNSSETDLEV